MKDNLFLEEDFGYRNCKLPFFALTFGPGTSTCLRSSVE